MRISKTAPKFRRIAICLAIVGIGLNAVFAQTIKTPEDRVKSFYRWYLKSINDGPDPDKKVMRSHLSKRLNGWYFSNAGQSVDYDIFTNGQDFNIAWADNIVIGKLTTRGPTAKLSIILAGLPSENWNMPLTVSLVKEGATWKIDRVRGTKTGR
jgi:hypothetical protein